MNAERGPDIFVSYAREDVGRAKQLAQALEDLGWSVFWDRKIPAGSSWLEVIGQSLERAGCVVVGWSQAAIDSRFVVEEAQEGDRRQVLVPVLFERVLPPLGMRSVQAADLSGWSGDVAAPEFRQFVADLSGLLGPPPKPKQAEEKRPEAEGSRVESRQADKPAQTIDAEIGAVKTPKGRPGRAGPALLRSGRGLALLVALAAVAVTIGWPLLDGSVEEPDPVGQSVQVPNLVGQDIDSVWKILEEALLVLDTPTGRPSLDSPPGTILEQSPEAGETVARGSGMSVRAAVLGSDFESGIEDWRTHDRGAAEPVPKGKGECLGGMGSCIMVGEGAGKYYRFSVPVAWTEGGGRGNWQRFYGGTLSYRMRLSHGTNKEAAEDVPSVRIEGDTGNVVLELFIPRAAWPTTGWKPYSLPLQKEEFRVYGQSVAWRTGDGQNVEKDEDFMAVLKEVSNVYIRGEYYSATGLDEAWLDSVRVCLPEMKCPIM